MKVSAKQYANVLYELTHDKSDSEILGIVEKFVKRMKKMGDMKKARDVISQFNSVYNDRNNIVEAIVTSARELSGAETEKVQTFIKKESKADNVIVKTVIDKNIKGGVIIRIGDTILDGSISGRLKQLNRSLSR